MPQTPTFRIDDISIKEFPSHDLLVHNQILRISDGSFLNDPKWYGHIKRNVFGQGITPLTHYRFRTPPMAAAVNAWTLEDTELTPPTVVPLQHAFDQENVIDAAISAKVKKVIALSTDKAAAPINLYGATKLASDKLFISANNLVGKKDIKFSVVRYGNVMGSRGSVIPYFLECRKKGVIPITDKKMTRFNITLDEGVQFVINCFSMMLGGELFVPKIPSFRIMDLAKAVAPGIKTKVVGIRPGEKIHEEMITNSDSLHTLEFKKHFTIVPNTKFTSLRKDQLMKILKSKGGKLRKKEFSYSSDSNTKFLSVSELRDLIQKLK